jgi:hypothetical protein
MKLFLSSFIFYILNIKEQIETKRVIKKVLIINILSKYKKE